MNARLIDSTPLQLRKDLDNGDYAYATLKNFYQFIKRQDPEVFPTVYNRKVKLQLVKERISIAIGKRDAARALVQAEKDVLSERQKDVNAAESAGSKLETPLIS